MNCPTVRVVSEKSNDNPHGYVVINEEDFDEAVHTLYKEPQASATTSQPASTSGGTAPPWSK